VYCGIVAVIEGVYSIRAIGTKVAASDQICPRLDRQAHQQHYLINEQIQATGQHLHPKIEGIPATNPSTLIRQAIGTIEHQCVTRGFGGKEKKVISMRVK
jgi:hypothetical protein